MEIKMIHYLLELQELIFRCSDLMPPLTAPKALNKESHRILIRNISHCINYIKELQHLPNISKSAKERLSSTLKDFQNCFDLLQDNATAKNIEKIRIVLAYWENNVLKIGHE